MVSVAVAVDELQVDQYDGPDECEAESMVKKGDQIGMHYTGTIDRTSKSGTPGTQFDSSRERGQPLTFTIGGGQVIKGWDEGLIGFCKGAKATLVIPPEMGYGASGMGGQIPGGATLNFDVEVMTVETEPSMRSRSAEVSQPIAPERPATPDAEPHPTPSHTRRRATPDAEPHPMLSQPSIPHSGGIRGPAVQLRRAQGQLTRAVRDARLRRDRGIVTGPFQGAERHGVR